MLLIYRHLFQHEDVQQVLLSEVLKNNVEPLIFNSMTPNYSYINTFNTRNRIKQCISFMIMFTKYIRISILR